MSATAKRTVSLPQEQAIYVDQMVERGAYASASEVVRAGLRALQERDAAVERWLREDVVPIALATQAEPERTLTADDVFGGIRRLHDQAAKSST